jgi:hypothetical protein
MSDAEYLTLRAEQELRAAAGAVDQRVRGIHMELANAYSFKLLETMRLERRATVCNKLRHLQRERRSTPAFSW